MDWHFEESPDIIANMLQPTQRSALALALLASAACSGEGARSTIDSALTQPVAMSPAECYRAPASVLGRRPPLDVPVGIAPGWLRFERAIHQDSGALQLVDADGAGLHARWRRTTGDSIEIRGFDDFMEVTLQASLSDSALVGSGVVVSDADVQRNAAGQLEPLRREWQFRADTASCAGIPPRFR